MSVQSKEMAAQSKPTAPYAAIIDRDATIL